MKNTGEKVDQLEQVEPTSTSSLAATQEKKQKTTTNIAVAIPH
jgi:hypothetical protein